MTIVLLSPLQRPEQTRSLRDAYHEGLTIEGRKGHVVDLCRECVVDTEALPLDAHGRGRDPFAFAHVRDVLPTSEIEGLLSWLEREQSWRATDGGFYRADVLAVTDCLKLPRTLSNRLLGAAGQRFAKQLAHALFGEDLHLCEPMTFHRMLPGHGIGAHSDQPMEGAETRRIVITLCRTSGAEAGGHFVLTRDADARSARVLIPLRSNEAIAFSLDARSYHAVTTIRSGTRFSLVLSFRGVTASCFPAQ